MTATRPAALAITLALGQLLGCGEGELRSAAGVASEPPGPAPAPAPAPGVDTRADDPNSTPPAADAPLPPAQPEPERSPEPDAAGAVPCAVERILTSQCMGCHDAAPRFGAPLPLHDLDALHAPAVSDPSRPAYALLAERAAHETRPMPPPPNPRLTPDEIETLRRWADQGAPAGEACAEPIPRQPEEELAPEDTETPAEACDYEVELRAHFGRGPDDANPFRVPNQADHYECFYFRPPWQGATHGLSFQPLIDDERVIHHWLLYVQEGAVFVDGDHDACAGRHDNANLVAGWAPGGQAYTLPADVGMHLPSGRDHMFVLEVHYNNAAGHRDALDRSGVKICATETLRPNTAGMQWLGTENLLMVAPGRHERSGTCRPNLQSPVHILSSSPHMHRRGVHMRTEIDRAGGGVDVLIDEPFDFENQVIYDTPATVNPGDSLVTTCTFDHPGGLTGFGPGTNDEMCYNFVVAWPYGALSTGGSLTNAENACLR